MQIWNLNSVASSFMIYLKPLISSTRSSEGLSSETASFYDLQPP